MNGGFEMPEANVSTQSVALGSLDGLPVHTARYDPFPKKITIVGLYKILSNTNV